MPSPDANRVRILGEARRTRCRKSTRSTHEGEVELAPQQTLCNVRRILAADGDMDIRQLIAEDAHGFLKPVQRGPSMRSGEPAGRRHT
jgi:hypothetical protein